MTDNTDLIALAGIAVSGLEATDPLVAKLIAQLADVLAARDAACGHLPNELVAKVLQWAQADEGDGDLDLTDDDWDALRAATFQAPGEPGRFQVTE